MEKRLGIKKKKKKMTLIGTLYLEFFFKINSV